MKVFSLFSGIGGFDLAAKNCGHEIVGACEWDRYARTVYARRFPGVTIHPDATKIDPGTLPDFDILCAGFPCQAFSTAGKRLGFAESRGEVFYEIIRIARQKRPQFLLLENVRGLLHHDEGRTFAAVLMALDGIGYDAQWQVLDSKYFVPQARERVFIVGHLRGRRAPEVFPVIGEDEEGAGIRPPPGPSWNGIPTLPVAPTLTNTVAKSSNSSMFVVPKTRCLNPEAHMSNRVYDSRGPSCTLKAHTGGKHGKTGAYLVSDRIRKPTPLEAERLQGFPDHWTDVDGMSDTQRYIMLGNAVTVPVIEFILRRLT